MTALSNIISVNVSRLTAAVARAEFGIPAIIGEFLTSKTSTAFTRTRYYGSMADLASDGWTSGDAVYDAAQKAFGQKQVPNRIMVGRIDSTDAHIAVSLDAIQLESADWYMFGLVGITSGKFTFSADLITGNIVTLSIDGVTVGPITYATSHANTMGLLETAIESAISGAVATVSTRSMTVVKAGRDLSPITVTVTGGASQPTTTIEYITDNTKSAGAASWTNSAGAKLFGHADADPTILVGNTGSTPGSMKGLGYDRTFCIYHSKPHEYAQFAWAGLELAKKPGQSTWAEKVIQGVTADTLTEGQYIAITGLNCNVFVPMGGQNVTLLGVCASGEPIESIRGIDYATSEIQADLWQLELNNDKVPYNDAGITLEENTLRGTGARMESAGIFVPGSFEVTAPKFADVSAADLATRTLRMGFTTLNQQAIIKTAVTGVVTLT